MARPGFSILVCPDPELIKQQVRRLLADGGFDRRVHFGDEGLDQDFWTDLGSPGLLGGNKALVLRRAEKLPADQVRSLTPQLGGFNDACWPIFCLEGPWEKKKPKIPAHWKKEKFWSVAERKGWLWQSPGLDRAGVERMAREWAEARGITVPRELAREFSSRLPPDAAAVASELDKLELALGERRELAREDLDLLAPPEEGLEIWAVLDALTKGRAGGDVWREVLRHRTSSESLLFPLLAGLTRDARQMWMILHGENPGLPGWLADKKAPVAKRLGVSGLARLFRLALEAEVRVKTGEMKEEQALQHLVADLGTLAAARGGRG
jgi:DNA polymerase-3 subunit delta